MQYEFWNSEQHSNWLADFMPIGASVGHSWPQCLHSIRMWPIPTDGLAWSFGWSVCLLSVDHYHKPCKNGIADRDSIRDVDSCESERARVPSWEGALLRGTCLAVHILKMAHKRQPVVMSSARLQYCVHLFCLKATTSSYVRKNCLLWLIASAGG